MGVVGSPTTAWPAGVMATVAARAAGSPGTVNGADAVLTVAPESARRQMSSGPSTTRVEPGNRATAAASTVPSAKVRPGIPVIRS
ncbi:MAG: hypothetical protein V9E93_16615 [Steroidobacteraceae bacterium]